MRVNNRTDESRLIDACRHILLLALLLATHFVTAGERGVDWKHETPEAKAERLKWWTDDRFGMFIHYGLYAIPARVSEWIRTRERMTDEQYDLYRQHFNPDLFDAREWARIAKRTGMKYAVLTAKHHDGFCMWDTKQTDFKITRTPFGRDLVREFLDAFRAEGLKVGLYYSLKDWNHPHFTIDSIHPKRPAGKGLGGTYAPDAEYDKLNAGRDMAKYRQYMKDQTRELLTEYGKIDIMWFDYSYPHPNDRQGKGRHEWDSEGLLAVARTLQPHLIIDNRLDLADTTWGWDFLTPEQRKVSEWPALNGVRQPWETCYSFSGPFGYNRDEGTWRSSRQLLELLSETVSKGGNLLLNVGPTARGLFEPRAMQRLNDIAAWMQLNGRSIYGCTAAPDDLTVTSGTALTWNPTTKALYIHIYDYPLEFLPLAFWDRIAFAQFLHDASELTVKPPKKTIDVSGAADTSKRNWGGLRLPTIKPDVEIPVIEVFLKDNAGK